MQIIDLPDDARITRVTAQTGQDPGAGAAYVLEDDESWWEKADFTRQVVCGNPLR